MSGRLEGKVAIVTGAASGIGYGIAKRFIEEGARVVAADVSPSVNELTGAFGTAVLPVVTDVSDEASVASMVRQGHDHFGTIDILINNAGVSGPIVRTHELTTEGFMRTLGINLLGQFFTIKNVVPIFLKNGGGRIVNMASISAFPPFTAAADYCSSKAAVKRLTESVAYEYAEDNIRANAIAPGHIETPIYIGIEEHKGKMAQRIAMKRFGEPEEIAGVALTLVTDETSYVTGQTITVDGGRMLT